MSRPRDFVGPYRLARLIRVGITTEVWEAVKTEDPTRYVLKLLKRDKKDKEHIASLKNEFECGKTLKHKNIIRIYDFSSSAETTYLVMEHFEHENLKLQLRSGPQQVAHLALKIGFSNEMANICERVGADVTEVSSSQAGRTPGGAVR